MTFFNGSAAWADMAARLHNFEPANLPQRARRTPDGGLFGPVTPVFPAASAINV
jgi:hypothetical protein